MKQEAFHKRTNSIVFLSQFYSFNLFIFSLLKYNKTFDNFKRLNIGDRIGFSRLLSHIHINQRCPYYHYQIYFCTEIKENPKFN